MSEGRQEIWVRIVGCRHPFLAVLAIGIAIRIAIGGMSVVYDSDYWATVIRNIEAGQGLYGMEGYYYTPAWGYILGLVSVFQDLFLNIGESAVRVVEALFVEGSGPYFTATVPSLIIIYSVKAPLFVCDFITAYVVMKLVREETGDESKSLLAFALTFLSPVLLMSSGIIAMPDTVSAMFAVLTMYCVKKDRMFIAGMTFAMAILVKFFPIFFVFIFVGYIFAVAGDRREAVKRLAFAVSGSIIVAMLVFTPQILEGTIEMCFQFLTDRTGTSGGDGLLDLLVGMTRMGTYALVLLGSAYLGYRMFRDPGEDPFRTLMHHCLIVATLVLVYPPTTQYIVILVPFLAYWIAASDSRFMLNWKILAVGSVVYETASNAMLLLPLSVWAGFPDLDAVLGAFGFWYSPVLGSITLGNIQFAIGGVLQCSAILLILWIEYGDRAKAVWEHRRSVSDRSRTDPPFRPPKLIYGAWPWGRPWHLGRMRSPAGFPSTWWQTS